VANYIYHHSFTADQCLSHDNVISYLYTAYACNQDATPYMS